MIVLLVHPVHGKMHVYDYGEVERNRKFGWMPKDEATRIDEALAEKLAPELISLPVVETKVYEDGTEATGVAPLPAESPAKRKPGRPPKAK